ncbi:MAG: DNA cytosine methyltransferase [Pseudohongiellaceae bacterium]
MNGMTKTKLTAIDLFSGVGGLSCGLRQAKFKVLACVENNNLAASSYKMNHKEAVMYQEDIRKLSPRKMLNDLGLQPGDLDLLAGCPPCQGFSSHRTRNKKTSVRDSRNKLIYEFIRFAEVMKPKTIMIENVPGLAKDNRIEKFKNKLIELGYIFDERSISVKDVSDYGVPQRRRRMILKVSKFGVIEDPEKVEEKRSVRDVIYNLKKPGQSGDALHDLLEDRSHRIKELIKLIPKDGGSREDLPRKYWLPCHIRYPEGYKDVYGRMAWKNVAPTITGGCVSPSKGRFLHPSQNRAITLREAALLQTFPKNYKFSLEEGKHSAALMIGNALPPEFIRKYANAIKKHIEDAK